MFRQGFRRCASVASAAAPFAVIRNRVAFSATQRTLLCASKPVSSFRSFTHASRNYSSEAPAYEAEVEDAEVEEESSELPPATPAEAVDFVDLAERGVHKNLLEAIINDMNYETMTPVQSKTINPALKGSDIVAQAKTGTGKTIAFLLPLLQRMITEDPDLASKKASRTARSDDVRGIVLSPTRELAEQIAEEARRLVKHTGLVVQSAVGGTQKSMMLRQTQRQGCHLLVATPGRLLDLLQDSRSGIEAPNLAALVLDEADRMLDVGFEKELDDIISVLPKASQKVRQTMLVSATIPKDVIKLARRMVRPDDFEFVQTISESDSLTHDRIPQHLVSLGSWNDVFPSMFELFDREIKLRNEDRSLPPFKAIVYFNTTALTELAGEMGYQRRKAEKMRIPSFSIQSQLSQMARTRAAERFRNTRSGVLFSSDVTARGMDFPNVTHVIQVDTPRDRESYIHRLGRTGRQNKEGEGWLFLPPSSMSSARRMLRGLPLKPNDTLQSAQAEAKAGELPPYHEEVFEHGQSMSSSKFGSAYTSIFGCGNADKDQLVNDLNTWATVGMGMAQPPPVSPSWARNMGMAHCNLNMQQPQRRGDGDYDRGRSDGGRGGNRFGGRRNSYRDQEDSSDPFSNIESKVRRDDFGGRGGGGRGRSFGGRGGGRFSGGRSRGSGSFRGGSRDEGSGDDASW
ncbi:hypothetical protein E4U40_001905 [Claviceps sp. LM458 group G5]|nr:hypothetical protein E4U40_001905 [Claviceps sp. LM458 group G5]